MQSQLKDSVTFKPQQTLTPSSDSRLDKAEL